MSLRSWFSWKDREIRLPNPGLEFSSLHGCNYFICTNSQLHKFLYFLKTGISRKALNRIKTSSLIILSVRKSLFKPRHTFWDIKLHNWSEVEFSVEEMYARTFCEYFERMNTSRELVPGFIYLCGNLPTTCT